LVGVASVLFFPLTRRIVADVRALEAGASRIAGGDLAARVAVRGHDEIGRLGDAFNRMAEQIADHQEQILAEERRRKEDEIARRLLEAENERRGRELEEAREFQLSLLPRELPRLEGFDLAVEMTTATEVGGDYYDFQAAPDGAVVFAIGDATGHGAAAGTLVTAVKSLFATAAVGAAPAAFLTAANAAIHRMGLVRRAMALAVGRVAGERLVVSSAGMPPILHFRAAAARVDEIVLPGTPLGARGEFPYGEVELRLAPGDALLFLSDGLPELPNAEGEPFGYERLRSAFGSLARRGAGEVVAGLRAAADAWSDGRPPVDDLTLLVLRRRDR
jgi:serine phosphatase RsbU (regulator of sigma subunit)